MGNTFSIFFFTKDHDKFVRLVQVVKMVRTLTCSSMMVCRLYATDFSFVSTSTPSSSHCSAIFWQEAKICRDLSASCNIVTMARFGLFCLTISKCIGYDFGVIWQKNKQSTAFKVYMYIWDEANILHTNFMYSIRWDDSY